MQLNLSLLFLILLSALSPTSLTAHSLFPSPPLTSSLQLFLPLAKLVQVPLARPTRSVVTPKVEVLTPKAKSKLWLKSALPFIGVALVLACGAYWMYAQQLQQDQQDDFQDITFKLRIFRTIQKVVQDEVQEITARRETEAAKLITLSAELKTAQHEFKEITAKLITVRAELIAEKALLDAMKARSEEAMREVAVASLENLKQALATAENSPVATRTALSNAKQELIQTRMGELEAILDRDMEKAVQASAKTQVALARVQELEKAATTMTKEIETEAGEDHSSR